MRILPFFTSNLKVVLQYDGYFRDVAVLILKNIALPSGEQFSRQESDPTGRRKLVSAALHCAQHLKLSIAISVLFGGPEQHGLGFT